VERSLVSSLVVVDLEETELVGVLAVGEHAEELTEVLLLEVLLGEVLKVALGESDLGLNDEGVLVLGDGDGLAEVAGLALNLDLVVHEALEVGENENVVLDGLGAVDDVSVVGLLGLLTLLDLLNHLCLKIITTKPATPSNINTLSYQILK